MDDFGPARTMIDYPKLTSSQKISYLDLRQIDLASNLFQASTREIHR